MMANELVGASLSYLGTCRLSATSPRDISNRVMPSAQVGPCIAGCTIVSCLYLDDCLCMSSFNLSLLSGNRSSPRFQACVLPGSLVARKCSGSDMEKSGWGSSPSNAAKSPGGAEWRCDHSRLQPFAHSAQVRYDARGHCRCQTALARSRPLMYLRLPALSYPPAERRDGCGVCPPNAASHSTLAGRGAATPL